MFFHATKVSLKVFLSILKIFLYTLKLTISFDQIDCFLCMHKKQTFLQIDFFRACTKKTFSILEIVQGTKQGPHKIGWLGWYATRQF